MSHVLQSITPAEIADSFRTAAAPATQSPPPKPKQSKTSPFSLRLSADERAYLTQKAGNRALGEYMRSCLLGDAAAPRQHKQRRPGVDQQVLAQLLARLGQSRLSQNLNQLAKANNVGTLPLPGEVAEELQAACREVAEMRALLVIALGLKPKEPKS